MIGKNKRLMLATVICVAVTLAAACAPSSKPGQPAKEEGKAAPAQVGQPKYGGILRTPNPLVAPSFDLISEGTSGTWLPTVPLYNSLLQYDILDHKGVPNKIIPDLAEKWDVSQDGLAYTFHLRKGVKFHDGVEFTSADAKFSLERIMAPPPKTPSLRQGWYKGFITNMETPDKYTLVVHVKEPYAAFVKLIATTVTPMVPKHILEPHNARITDIKLLVGTGPFKMVEGDRNVGYKLTKNTEYYRNDRPFLDGIDMPVIVDRTLMTASFKTGRLDDMIQFTQATLSEWTGLKRDLGDKIMAYETLSAPSSGTPFWFNTTKKPYDDVRVRKAVRLALDKPAIGKVAYDGVGCVGGYFAPSGEWGRPCEYWAQKPGFRSPTSEDIAEAKKLLSEAGFPNGFEANLNNGFGPTTDNAHEIMIPMLEKIGIKAKIRPLERTAFYNSMDNNDFDMALLGPGLNIEDPNDYVGTMYVTGAGRNYSRFSDPVVDDLFQKQSREMDPEKRNQLARQLEDRLVEMVPSITMNHGVWRQAHYTYVKGFKATAGRWQDQRREEIWLDK